MGFEQQGEVMEQIKPIELSADDLKLLLGTDSKKMEKRTELMKENGIGENEIVAITVDGERKVALTTEGGFECILSLDGVSDPVMAEWLAG